MSGVCSHSIGRRLSTKLALVTMLVIGALCGASYWSVSMMVKERNLKDLELRCDLIADILALEAKDGGRAAVLRRLETDAPMRARTRLEVWDGRGELLYADRSTPAMSSSSHLRDRVFTVAAPGLPGGELRARYTVDYTADAQMGQRWAAVFVGVTLAAGAVVALATGLTVRRSLRPLRVLAQQTRTISPQDLTRRLSLPDPAEELLPWIEQFNGLMDRLERAYAQLEAFNADVAHELRTPLANLIGQTELALSRERPAAEMTDTLVSNLEEMQRLSAMVNDMLFLSHADRGAVARRGAPVSLAMLARQVVEFHEAPLEDAGLSLRIEGDALLPVDESLFKRALSNLLGNATRYARRGSTVVVRIAPEAESQVQVAVQNEGEPIDAQSLPRLFDRFFRADASRTSAEAQHNGLGLAIVAAIARMHAGRTLAESQGGVTRVGFTLAAG